MDWSQALVLAALALAALNGRDWPIMIVLAANFASTALIAANPLDVAAIDAMSGVALILIGGARAKAVGWFYCPMLMAYALGGIVGFQNYATYAIVDLIGVLQYAVAGHADNGGSGIRRGIRNSVAFGRRHVRRNRLGGGVGGEEISR